MLLELKAQYVQEAIDQGLLSTPASATATTATNMRAVPRTRNLILMVHITDAELSILLNACTKVKAALRQDKSPVAQNIMEGIIESEQDSYK